MKSRMWSVVVRMQQRRRPWVALLLPEEVMQRQPSILGEVACSTRMDVTVTGWITHVG
jgi:hypothetical protein